MVTPQRWNTRIKKWEAEFNKRKSRYEMASRYYRNEFPVGLITVNLVFSYGRALVPQLYFKNPSVSVQIRGELSNMSRMLQEVDTEILRQMRIKYTIKKMILSAFLTGRGVGKLGFYGEDQKVYDPTSVLKPHQPWFLHVLTGDFAFHLAPNGMMEDLPWVAMRTMLRPTELEEMEDLTPYAKEKLKDITEDTEDDPIEMWEVWDRESGKKGLLWNEDWATKADDFDVWPYYILDFNPDMGESFPISDAELMLKVQEEYNDIKTHIHEHRRVSVLKLLAKKGAINDTERQKLERGAVGTLVEVETALGPLGDVLLPFNPQVPADLFTVANTVQNDIRDMIGFTRNQLGEFQTPRRTFGEAAMVQEAIQLRLDERRDMVADMIEQVMMGANNIIFQNWDVKDAARYLGVQEGEWNTLKKVGKDDYVISIVPDSTLPLTKATQKQQAIQLFQLLNMDPLTDQIELRKMLFDSHEGINPMKMFNAQLLEQVKASGGTIPVMPGMEQPKPGGNGTPRRTQGARTA